jgi:N-dimethylarginine dimethylaminohydrolase
MSYSAHSEFGPLHSVIIKPAGQAFVDHQKIQTEWEALNYTSKPDLPKAIDEYLQFEHILKSYCNEIHYLPAESSLSMDSIYCRDAGIATDKGMILCNMGKPARKPEPEALQAFLKSKGIPILGHIETPGTIEGGDVAWIDKQTLAVGHSYRTNESGIEQLKSILKPQEINIIVASLPHYKGVHDVFHLMSVFSPVDKDLAIVYSPLMPISFRNELLRRGIELIEVPDHEFDSMGCNVLALAPRICMMVKGNPVTSSKLRMANCKVIEYDGLEISIKGGGGPTCLTRPLLRTL